MQRTFIPRRISPSSPSQSHLPVTIAPPSSWTKKTCYNESVRLLVQLCFHRSRSSQRRTRSQRSRTSWSYAHFFPRTRLRPEVEHSCSIALNGVATRHVRPLGVGVQGGVANVCTAASPCSNSACSAPGSRSARWRRQRLHSRISLLQLAFFLCHHGSFLCTKVLLALVKKPSHREVAS